ncbi:MAG: ABC transporter ATP-binding protein [Alphaproteobacteria bacterium]|nr:ABC transporter ATP-binding protein [Alphaproteobacteria bacterium]
MNRAAGARGNALEVRGAHRRFGSVAALAGIDLSVGAGELLTLLGPSGSGKSTLLKIIAGYDTPDAGVVRLGGQDVTAVAPARRNIGMVFQNYALFPHMTVAENIAFPLEMRRLDRAAIGERVRWALETVGLADYDVRRPSQLSGGQQQRVALARAIVFEPGLLLLDEPFGALDKKLREQMQLEVKSIQRRLGLTTLFVTHDQEEALILSDRIAVMDQGRIEQVDTPTEIYRRPVNRFVAQFIGDSNLFAATVAAVDGGRARLRTDRGLELGAEPPAAGARAAPGTRVTLVVRPERIERVRDDGPAENRIAATVRDAIYVGDGVKYRLELEGGAGTVTVAWSGAEGALLATGTRVAIAIPPAALHWVEA